MPREDHVVFDVDAGEFHRFPAFLLFVGYNRFEVETFSVHPALFVWMMMAGAKSVTAVFGSLDTLLNRISKDVGGKRDWELQSRLRNTAKRARMSPARARSRSERGIQALVRNDRAQNGNARALSHRKLVLLSEPDRPDLKEAAMFGSANFSFSGLNGNQGEITCYSENPKIVDALRRQFEWSVEDSRSLLQDELQAWNSAIQREIAGVEAMG